MLIEYCLIPPNLLSFSNLTASSCSSQGTLKKIICRSSGNHIRKGALCKLRWSTNEKEEKMELHILEHRLKVASIAKDGIQLFTHGLIKLAFLPSKTRCKFFSLTETPEDYTIIVDEEGFKELPGSDLLSVADETWLALNVVSGGGSFSSSQPIGVTKIAKSVIAPLADHNISVFMLSTYQTDFILVREKDLPLVMHTLSAEFTILRVVNGEPVAADHLGITNGFVKPKLVQRPVIHPLSSPSNKFCVTSLDPDTLPTVATLLMDVMFYSNGMKDSAVGNDENGHIRFFSFSLIEGYISLVMDVQTQQRFPNNLLFTSASGELWKMVRIGGQPLGFDECGIVAQIAEPLAAADIPAYYISTFKFDHALVPEENINSVINALQVSQNKKQ
ncbi:cytosolic arginine sensor for mTORC1 subunit 2 [Rhincodon typus]|uniref:cytosolic arginine sensor for mTORC1 subunit 2 n=1 Tax=Rhincodon typus TaxID=259920 RepID=UPI00202F7612|nr:cytosolic arginine sensor for mTORC1 subunit 2 [Rhincodon typus]